MTKHDCWPWNVQIRCPHCGKRTQPEWGEARFKITDDGAGDRYITYDCDNCDKRVLDWEWWHRSQPREEYRTRIPDWVFYALLLAAFLAFWLISVYLQGGLP